MLFWGVPRDAPPSIQGSPESCRGWVMGRELVAAGWAAAALSWCRMRPCVWPPPACNGDVSFAANLLALVTSKGEFI